MEVQIAVAGQSANNISGSFPLASIMYRLTNYLIYITFIRTKTYVLQLWALKMFNGTYLEN
jgi:hypothetical protein